MLKTLAFVEVQPSVDQFRADSPLAGIARRRFGGKTLLEWVVRRVSDAERVDGVIVLAGDDRLSRSLAEHCPPDVPVFHSPETDGLGRLASAIRHTGCQAVIRLNVSHPFVDPALLDRLIGSATSGGTCDYAGYALADGRSVMQSKLGVFAEWCRAEAILLADRMAKNPADRTDATRFLYSHPEVFALKLLAVPSQLDRDDLRLAIHDEEDWEHVQLILDALGPESLDWQLITSLLDRQPNIRQRMAHLNRAEAGAY